jgi:hypothetical protein
VRSVVRSRASPRRPPDRVDGVCGLLPRRRRPDDRCVVSRRADPRAVRGHDRDSRAWRRPTQSGSRAGPMAGSERDQESEAGGTRGSERKVKSHLTCGGSQHHFGRSHEALPLWGTSWFDNRRGARSVSPRVPPNTRAGCRRRADRGRTACRDTWPRPARDAPEGAALAVPRPPRKPATGGGGQREFRADGRGPGDEPSRVQLPPRWPRPSYGPRAERLNCVRDRRGPCVAQ